MKSGKKIAIGGSMTLTTQAVVRYTPSISGPEIHPGRPAAAAREFSHGWPCSTSSEASSADGTFAPSIVIHSTSPSIRIIVG